jgi:hypothetical protein
LISRNPRTDLVAVGEDDCDRTNFSVDPSAGKRISNQISGVSIPHPVAAYVPRHQPVHAQQHAHFVKYPNVGVSQRDISFLIGADRSNVKYPAESIAAIG